MKDIVRFERIGTSYIGLDGSGKPVALVTEVRSINTAARRVKRSNDPTERVAR